MNYRRSRRKSLRLRNRFPGALACQFLRPPKRRRRVKAAGRRQRASNPALSRDRECAVHLKVLGAFVLSSTNRFQEPPAGWDRKILRRASLAAAERYGSLEFNAARR